VNQNQETVDLVRNQPPQLPISLEQCQQLMAFIQHQFDTPIAFAHSIGHTHIPQDNMHSKMTGSSSTSGIFTLIHSISFFLPLFLIILQLIFHRKLYGLLIQELPMI
jgi:hypothetical protein